MLPLFEILLGTAAASLGGLTLYEVGGHRQRHESQTAHGTAGWASAADLRAAGINRDEGLIVGAEKGRPLYLRTDRHMLTIAPTRSGKGVSTVIPNLLTWPGSVFCIDPKGENAMVSAARRRQLGQRVHILDPWGVTGQHSASFNPLASIDPDSKDAGDEAALIADALVQAPPDAGDGSFWIDEARALIGGLILHIVTGAPPEHRHLPMLRRLLTGSPDEFQRVLKAMAVSAGAGGLVARAAHRLMQKADREFSGVVSTAQSQTHFLDSPRLAVCLERSSFSMDALRGDDPLSIYLVLPPTRLGTHGRWLRLLVAHAIDRMAGAANPPAKSVLFLLDEFAALGHLGAIQRAMGLMAGFGCQLWPIVQDLAQLQGLYPGRWPTFLSNAGALQVWSISDRDTMQYVSAMLGNRTVTVRGESGSVNSGSQNYSRMSRPLMTPDELRRLRLDQQILLMPGRRPALTGRAAYYKDRAFSGLFAPNSYYRGGGNG
jgi:type IV secretion system protein VirD4